MCSTVSRFAVLRVTCFSSFGGNLINKVSTGKLVSRYCSSLWSIVVSLSVVACNRPHHVDSSKYTHIHCRYSETSIILTFIIWTLDRTENLVSFPAYMHTLPSNLYHWNSWLSKQFCLGPARGILNDRGCIYHYVCYNSQWMGSGFDEKCGSCIPCSRA